VRQLLDALGRLDWRFDWRPAAWLPNICEPQRLFVSLVVIQLVVLVIVLAPLGTSSLENLGPVSLYAQWLGLMNVATLCQLRKFTGRRHLLLEVVIILALLGVMTALSAALVFVIERGMAFGFIAPQVRQSRFVLGSVAIVCLVTATLLRYWWMEARWRAELEAQAEARVQALQARIRPHFLFNTLNTIAALIRLKPQRAEEIMEDLAELFRAALREEQQQFSLAEELSLLQQYFRIEQERLGETRLTLKQDIAADCYSARLPALILQPLLENAVYHGIQPLADGGEISLRATRIGDQLCIVLANPIAPTQLVKTSGHGMALANIRERLALRYRGRASLQAEPRAGLFHVELRLPFSQ
jgi:two-component system, LytTR family, sensor histidine kinase AlgZ